MIRRWWRSHVLRILISTIMDIANGTNCVKRCKLQRHELDFWRLEQCHAPTCCIGWVWSRGMPDQWSRGRLDIRRRSICVCAWGENVPKSMWSEIWIKRHTQGVRHHTVCTISFWSEMSAQMAPHPKVLGCTHYGGGKKQQAAAAAGGGRKEGRGSSAEKSKDPTTLVVGNNNNNKKN